MGDVKINLGLPLMVLVNKSDILEREDKGKDWDSKAEVI
jgi:dynein light intermediate chain 1